MKKYLAVLILAAVVLSSASAFAIADRGAKPVATVFSGNNTSDENGSWINRTRIMPRMGEEGQDDDIESAQIRNRIKACKNYFEKKGLEEPSEKTCRLIVNAGKKCYERMTELGMEDPSAVCGRIADVTPNDVKRRSYISNVVRKAVSEWNLRRAEGIVKKNPAAQTVLDALSEEKQKVFLHLPRAEQKKIIKKGKDAAKRALERMKLVKVKINDLAKKREIARDKIQKARQRFEQAKNRYEEAVKKYNEKKNEFLRAKSSLMNCGENESDECQKLKNKIKEDAKEFIANGIDKAIEHLNKVKSKVMEAEGLDEERASEIIEEIDSDIEKLNELKKEVQGAQTKEEIQKAARELAKEWEKLRSREKVHTADLFRSSVWGIVQRSVHLEDKLDIVLTKLGNKTDISEIEEKIEEFSSLVADAKEKIEQSEKLLKQAHDMRTNATNETDRDAIKDLADKGKDIAREAHESLKEAQKLLVEIVREIKSKGGDFERGPSDTEEYLNDGEVYEVTVEDEQTGESE